MHISPIAEAVLLLHIPVCIVFFATMRVDRATAWALLTAALFLPEGIEFDPPGLPPFNKFSISGLVTFIAISAKKVEGSKRSSALFFIVASILLIGKIGTVATNQDSIVLAPTLLGTAMTWKDLISEVSSVTFKLFVPFLIGRRVYRTPEATRELLRIITTLGVVYAFLMLIEIRMAPMLNVWIYGYHQHSFAQAMRDGGYRPVVFMAHGLAVAMFCVTAILSAVTLEKVGDKVLGLKSGHLALFMGVVLLFSHSLGALIYALIVTPLMWSGKPKLLAFFATFVAIIVIFIPLLRSMGWFPTEAIVDFFMGISTERAASLKFRFDQETTLLAKWTLRPWFGYGGYGRARIYNDDGEDQSVTDGEWMIQLSNNGIFGFVGEFLLLLAPIWIARKHIKSRSASPEVRILFAGLAMVVAVNVLDLVPNGLFSFIPVMLAGALFGFSESLSDPAEQRRLTAQAPLTLPPS